MSLGGDHRADELEREPDRARLERRQTRRRAEGVAEELLVDVDLVAAQLGVDGVAAAAEVDEVQQREVLLERLLGDLREPLDEVARRDGGARLLATGREQVGEERLEHPEPLRVDRARSGAPATLLGRPRLRLRRRRRRAGVALDDAAEARRDAPAQLVRLERNGAAVESQDPGGEVREVGVRRDEDAVLDLAVRLAVRALDPPGRVAARARCAPRRRSRPSATGAAAGARRPRSPSGSRKSRSRRVANLMSLADAQHLEGADRVASVVAPDDVPAALVRQERVGVERPLALHAAGDRPVLELDRPLLGDRRLELAQPPGQLGRVVRVADLDALGDLRRRVREARTAERQVLEREPERLCVRELSFEQVQAGLQRRELVVREFQPGRK